ncbi:MAG: MFS transporter [Rhizobiaceae bacterium]|nr:MAG: MFS transporter [Rhizobiaceae bacterium]
MTEASAATTEDNGIWRNPSFRHFASSRVLSAAAFQATSVSVGWLLYDRTHNAFDLGLVGLCQFLPMMVLTFLVGHVADRFDRRRIGLICQIVEAAVLLLVAAGVWMGWLTVGEIFIAVAFLGAAQAFERPTMAALLPSAVSTTVLPQAIAGSSSVGQTAMIVGPSLGGLLYGLAPVTPFLFAAFCFAAASLNVVRIRIVEVPARREPVSLKSVFAGVSFIWSRPIMLGTISLDLFAVLLGGATALLPIYARDILHAGPWGLGLLRSAPAVGALMMSLVLTRSPLSRKVGMKMFYAVAVFGLGTLVFALSTSIILSVVSLFVIGAADNVSVVVRSSLVQLLTPDPMRGRVNAVNSLFIGTSNQLGEFESGTLAGFLGAVPAAVIGGAGTILVVLVWMRLFPALRDADRFAS